MHAPRGLLLIKGMLPWLVWRRSRQTNPISMTFGKGSAHFLRMHPIGGCIPLNVAPFSKTMIRGFVERRSRSTNPRILLFVVGAPHQMRFTLLAV